MHSVCPSTTGTRLHCAETATSAGSIVPPAEGVGQGFERQDQADRRAVRVGDDAGGECPAVLRRRQQGEVVRVHLGHDQRNVRVHAVGAGVGDDQAAAGEPWLDVSRHAGVQGREDDVQFAAGQFGMVRQFVDRPDGHGRDRVVDRPGLNPGHRVAVELPGRALGSGQRGQLEPGVFRQQGDEALAHGAGRAEDGGAQGLVPGCHGEAPRSAQARRMSPNTPPAVSSVPAPGPWTISGRAS